MSPVASCEPLSAVGEENMYWDEIATLCIDMESLRLQRKLLCKAICVEKKLEKKFKECNHSTRLDDKAFQESKDRSYIISARIAMLQCK
jgi:hypothetical protein